jgi:small-conductance mechanosensitive channel
MSKEQKIVEKRNPVRKKPIIITFVGTLIMILLIMVTLDISHRNPNTFISAQQKYILSIESIILVAFVVEMLARLVTLPVHTPKMKDFQVRLRFIVRIVGYCIGSLLIISILASNAALGISVGAIVGAVIVFSTQSIVSSVLASVLIFGTRMIRIGEEITLGTTKGIIADINLTHTIISIEEDVVFIPNSVIISSAIRRKKRNSDINSGVNDW